MNIEDLQKEHEILHIALMDVVDCRSNNFDDVLKIAVRALRQISVVIIKDGYKIRLHADGREEVP